LRRGCGAERQSDAAHPPSTGGRLRSSSTTAGGARIKLTNASTVNSQRGWTKACDDAICDSCVVISSRAASSKNRSDARVRVKSTFYHPFDAHFLVLANFKIKKCPRRLHSQPPPPPVGGEPLPQVAAERVRYGLAADLQRRCRDVDVTDC
jgi:hypothetical protein